MIIKRMNLKKHSLLNFLCLCVTVCGIVWGIGFIPRPIVVMADHPSIFLLKYNRNGSGDLTQIQNFDEEAVLSCLSGYKEQKTLSYMSRGYQLADFTFIIQVHDDNGLKQIMLGEERNFSYQGIGTRCYKIWESERIREDLTKLLETGK